MTWLYCGRCRDRFEPDEDHYWIDAEFRTISDRNETDEYVLCMECAREVLDEWGEPA